MFKRLISVVLSLMTAIAVGPAFTLTANAADAPASLWVAPTEENGIPVQIDAFKAGSDSAGDIYQIYLPGDLSAGQISDCSLSWDGDARADVDGQVYNSGECPVPLPGREETIDFIDGSTTLASLRVMTYQGSENVVPVFIDIDETFKEEGETEPHTIEAMNGDPDHEKYCVGRIFIDGGMYDMPKMKGRGNATWKNAKDKRPYNINITDSNGKKINFPGIDSKKTKKWSFLAESMDHSLLRNRAGFHLAHELGVGQDTASADVWMNGEYKGCYTVTPKTDSFVADEGFMIEQDNYLEGVENGGDPQFRLEGLEEVGEPATWDSRFNRITVKKIGDDLLGTDESGNPDESPANMDRVAQETIKPWLQDAWDAIRSETGYNSKGKYYTDYIDIESFAKMYLMQEYVKSYDVCAGSLFYYRDGQTENDKLIAGPIWDLDNALGSVYRNRDIGEVGDRRSGRGAFIPGIYEYKTSVYKTISKHDDFMEEVLRQYNRHISEFNSLPDEIGQLAYSISASAAMNHYKVEEMGPNLFNDYRNYHLYERDTTLEAGTQYQQNYKATTNSKTDWGIYVANLKTYATVRSLWFRNTYTCTHQTMTEKVDEEYLKTPADCTHPAVYYKSCGICGAKGTETFEYGDASGHKWKSSYTIDKAPTVNAEGSKSIHCSVCGGVKPGSAVSIAKLDPAGKGAPFAAAEKAILKAPTDEGPAGTKYTPVKLRSTKQTGNSITIKWTKTGDAKKYVIYGNKCGKTRKMKKLASVSAGTLKKTFRKVAGKKMRKGSYYKFILVAVDKNNKVVSTSKVVHVATKGGKVGNYKSVTVKKAVITKAANLKKGSSLKLNAKAVRPSGLKVRIHRGLRYISTNKKIAVVSKGTVKAREKGTCYIYVYAQNGRYKKIKVTVR